MSTLSELGTAGQNATFLGRSALGNAAHAAALDGQSQLNQKNILDAARRQQDQDHTTAVANAVMTGSKILKDGSARLLQSA